MCLYLGKCSHPPLRLMEAERAESFLFQGNPEAQLLIYGPCCLKTSIGGLGIHDADLILVFHMIILHRKPQDLLINQ